ncbi:hypothetical protein N6H14_28340 [Paenibacillus sp. CC-CFT747]|nr:hypothetical protein N6H14_28340 [Paenibacillus sp. CC-CFT747]
MRMNQEVAPDPMPFEMPAVEVPVFPERTVSIADYGAVGDGMALNTEAIASAIRACSAAGGGTVLIPPGMWLTGPIRLESGIRLHAEAGALVVFSKNRDDYPLIATSYEGLRTVRCLPALYGADLTNIAITGEESLTDPVRCGGRLSA